MWGSRTVTTVLENTRIGNLWYGSIYWVKCVSASHSPHMVSATLLIMIPTSPLLYIYIYKSHLIFLSVKIKIYHGQKNEREATYNIDKTTQYIFDHTKTFTNVVAVGWVKSCFSCRQTLYTHAFMCLSGFCFNWFFNFCWN